MFGLLIYKPQLGILIPIALIAGRHWRAFGAAALVAGTLVVASVMTFGAEIWAEYLRNLALLKTTILEDGDGVWHRFVSVFVGARRLGATIETAYVLQATAAVLACIIVGWVWSRALSANVKNATLLLATCFATPYLQDYDLVFGAFVVIWLWQDPDVIRGHEKSFQIAAALFLLLPVAAAPLAHVSGLPLGPLFMLPIFFLTLQSCRARPSFSRAHIGPTATH